MKRINLFTTPLLILVGWLLASCDKSSSTTPDEVSLKVETTKLELAVGETAQIKYTVTPSDARLSCTSSRPDIATVSETGLVTAVSEGVAEILIQLADQRASVTVTVTQAITQELPLLEFGVLEGDALNRVKAHEASLGRTPQEVSLSEYFVLNGYVNTNLTITACIYDFSVGNLDLIQALSKESLADCEQTRAMLRACGFSTLREETTTDGRPALYGTNDDNPKIFVLLYDDPIPDYQSTLYIIFSKKIDPVVTKLHEVVPDVQDFPSLAALKSLDETQIKSFESTLGFRAWDAEKSVDGDIVFVTNEAMQAKSNISAVIYHLDTTPDGYNELRVKLNCIQSYEELNSEPFRAWLATNGFDKNIVYDAMYGQLSAFNEKGDQCVAFYDMDSECFMLGFVDADSL